MASTIHITKASSFNICDNKMTVQNQQATQISHDIFLLKCRSPQLNHEIEKDDDKIHGQLCG